MSTYNRRNNVPADVRAKNIPLEVIAKTKLLEIESIHLVELTKDDRDSLGTDEQITHALHIHISNLENASALWMIAWPKELHALKEQLLSLPDYQEEEPSQ